MVLKGYIIELPEPGDNHFQVRIPFIEDNTGLEIIMTALLCSQPGNYGGYGVGDCVFVTFEGDKHMEDEPVNDVPVIMGKLYLDGIEEVHNNCVLESLTVTDNASLPSSTKFGTHSASELFSLTQNVNYLTNKVSELEDRIKALESKEN